MWGKELYFDGTQVQANADDDAMLPRFYVEAMQAKQAMQTHLAALFPEHPDDQCDQAQAKDNSEPDEPDTPGTPGTGAGPGPGLLRLTSKLPRPSQPTQAQHAQGEQVTAEPHDHEHGHALSQERCGEVDQMVDRD